MMMKYKNLLAVLILAAVALSCNNKKDKGVVAETRTSGTVTILVDETFSDILDEQIEVFKSDYPQSTFTLVKGNQEKILTTFLNDSIRVIILPRMLNEEEEKVYAKRRIPVNSDRFAIDGLALVTTKNNIDSNISVKEVIDILKGNGTRNLVFDNAYSSTIQYFKTLAGIKELPKKGVFTLQSNNDVISFVGKNPNYIGVVGLNWLLHNNAAMSGDLSKIMLMNVKNLPGKKGDDKFYKPTQDNLMAGFYPFFRNIYVINAEGRNGLGTGFATWLTSDRGQLIVLQSGLGPNNEVPRNINLKSN